MSVRDIPLAISLTMLFQTLGQVISISVTQTVFLTQFVPQMIEVNSNLTATDIIEAGATGLKALVTEDQLPTVLLAYAKSLDLGFIIGVVMAVMAILAALPVEWKSVKKPKTKAKEMMASEVECPK